MTAHSLARSLAITATLAAAACAEPPHMNDPATSRP
jgi:hypothetical protein